jgi:sn-glycerol 3-phosphate transport system substrate-binding protein
MNDAGNKTDLTNPKVVEALKFWVDLNKVHGIHPPGIQEWGTTPSDFLEERIAMIWTTTGNLTNLKASAKFDFGLAPYPARWLLRRFWAVEICTSSRKRQPQRKRLL